MRFNMHKKTNKQIYLIVVLVVLLIFMGFLNKKEKVMKLGVDEVGKANVEKYLQDKYGEEFVCTYASYLTGDITPERYGEIYAVHAKKDEDVVGNNDFYVLGMEFDKGLDWLQ